MPLPRFAKLDPARRDAILEAALDEFARHGFEASSFNRMLARAGVSKGAFYYYFADKEDLYLTVLERALGDLSAVTVPTGADSVLGYWTGIRRLYRDVIDLARRDPRVLRLLQQSAEDLVRLTHTPRMRPMLEAMRSHVERLLRDGQAVGAVRDDLGLALLSGLTFAVGEVLDRHMMSSGELQTEAGAEAALDRGMDTLKRLLEPRRVRP